MRHNLMTIVYDNEATVLSLSFLSNQGINIEFIPFSFFNTDYFANNQPQIILFNLSVKSVLELTNNYILRQKIESEKSVLSVIALVNKADSGLWKMNFDTDLIFRPFHYSVLLAKIHKHIYAKHLKQKKSPKDHESTKYKYQKIDRL